MAFWGGLSLFFITLVFLNTEQGSLQNGRFEILLMNSHDWNGVIDLGEEYYRGDVAFFMHIMLK